MLLDGTVTALTRWGILATGHIASMFARDLALLTNEARLVAVGSAPSRGRWHSRLIMAFAGYTTPMQSWPEILMSMSSTSPQSHHVIFRRKAVP